MAEKNEKETASAKLNTALENNKKILIGVFAFVIAAIVLFVVGETIGSKAKDKNLAAVDALTYELTNGSADLDEAALNGRRDEVLNKLLPYTKKSGVSGVRANMLAAEIAYQKADYEGAVAYWDAASSKGKKAYTAPLADYNKAVCYEQMGKIDEAAAAYKAAADNEDFLMRTHAMFSYGRVLETKGDYAGAAAMYQTLNEKNAGDTWANLAKTRLIDLKIEGKVE